MLRRVFCLTILLATPALTTPAFGDEAGSETGLLLTDWNLVSIDGAAVTAQTTVRLDEPGRISGQGPCNRYFGEVQGTLPAFRPQAIGSTKMACPDLALESQYFQTLQLVDHAEIIDGVLSLTGGGHAMVFEKPLD